MSSDTKEQDTKGINRRELLKAGAVGVAGIAATGLGMGTASAKTVIPDQENLWTNSKTGRRVAIINDAMLQIGPPLARAGRRSSRCCMRNSTVRSRRCSICWP